MKKLEPKLMALDARYLHPGNFDVSSGADLVLARRDDIVKYRAAIEAEFKRFDFDHIDLLEEYAVASKYLAAIEDNAPKTVPEAAKTAFAEGVRFRELFASQANTFVTFGVFDSADAAVVRDIEKLPRSYNGVSDALIRFSALFTKHAEKIAGKSPLTTEQIASANAQGIALGKWGAELDEPEKATDVEDRRRRAVTLLANAWRDIRLAMEWVRREQKDAAKIVPGFSGASAASRGADKGEPDLPEDKREELEKAKGGGATPAPAPVDPTKPPLPDAPFKR
ncbi:MAG: hypothetical protein JNK05_08900 [Myxococcales bacterium]|nr:hypothetical protein [Myxococcales bacterium]